MKRTLSFLLVFMCIAGTASANEINYYNQSWADIKAKAKAEHKYIFMDCFTDWCGWCKVMDKETMTDKGIISTMDEKFIAVKMDMEKGEGIQLAMKYHVGAFPTFLFFDPNGNLVYQSMGYQKTPEFSKELSSALDKTKQISMPGYSASLDIDFPEFYKKMFAGNGKREFAQEPVVTAYLDKQKDLFSEVNWGVISRCELNDKYTKYFLDNIKKYKALYGATGVDDKISSYTYSRLQKAIKDSSVRELGEVLQLVDKYVSEDADYRKIYFRLTYYKSAKNWGKCIEAMSEYISKKGYENTSMVNDLSWTLYENCFDTRILKQAAIWMKEVVAKEPTYAYMDTYAAVLYKSGQLKEAEVYAKKAIDEGKKSGDKTTSTEELMKKIRAEE